ncbi:MAG: mechanosensitive ion channel family protein, partial [Proteobacteria bacterium]|nr:mechanosensitive ion channel family protein [Pseudomonadota bacterium]
SLWGVDMTAWLASAGIAGIAIGFAAKDSLANLISGVWILADGPYNIGDYVVLDGGERGRVTHIGLRSTRMFTRDYTEVSVPNAVIGNAKIVNESAGINPKYRVRVPVGVSYGSNIDLVEKTLLEVATKSDLICEDPAPICRFRKFGASSVDYEMMGWVEDPELRGRAVHFLNREVYLAFEKLGIEIPYSKQDLYIKSLPRQD